MSAGRLAGRRILVTGAASGIGWATAALFAAEGARLALLDRDPAGLAALRDASPGSVEAVADVTDPAGVRAAVDGAAERLGGLDGLVNAAGIASVAGFRDTGPDLWRRIMAVNLDGPYLVCRACLPHLERGPAASIVNVASASGLLPSGANAAYAASKGGLITLTKALAAELGPRVRVNAVCPGTVDTPMVAGLGPRDAAFEARIRATYALGRMAEPAEIAAAILFLTAGDSSFVTGAALAVDGGRSYH